jgi:hypothetical protein
MTAQAAPVPTAVTPVLRVALNEHLASVLARSSVRLDPAALGDTRVILLTEPTTVRYDDPRDAALSFDIGTGRFVALDQAAGWVYQLNATPQERATGIQETVAVARRLERSLGATAWQRDPEPPWGATDDAVAVWVHGRNAALPVARFTAGPAEVQLTLKRTGKASPSERLQGKRAETFYVNLELSDLSRLDAYQARVIRERQARGDGSRPLPLSVFIGDTTLP